MPSTKKTLPNDRNRVTVSAGTRVSVKKTKKESLQLEGSFLEKATNKKTVGTSSNVEPVTATSTPSQKRVQRCLGLENGQGGAKSS